MKGEIDLLIINASNCLWKLPPREFFESESLEIKVREKLSMDELKKSLKRNGFDRVSVVKDQGEYSVRGSIIDLYSPNEINPIRIDIDGKPFNLITDDSVKDFFGTQYYVFHLEAAN